MAPRARSRELGDVAVYRTAQGRLIALMPAEDYRRFLKTLDEEKET